MENEQNLGSQEPTTNSAKPANSKLIGMIAAVVAVILLIILCVNFFPRSAKSTVKSYVKAFQNAKAQKVMDLMDFEGVSALESISSYSYSDGTTYDFSKFDEAYKDMQKKVKELNKDEKKAYDDVKKQTVDAMQKSLDELKKEKIKFEVKNIKTEKVDGSKKLTKVTCDIKMKKDKDEQTKEGVVFYTVKKGTRHYIVGMDGFGL